MNYNWNKLNYFLNSEEKNININFNTYQLCAFKKIIEYISNSNMSWEYFSSNGSKHYLDIIVENLSNMNSDILNDIPKEILSLFVTHIRYDVTEFKKIYIQTYMKAKKINEDTQKHLEIINNINTLIYDEIMYIIESIKNCLYINNYFLEAIQLKKGNIVGFYDFNKILIDGGNDISDNSLPKIIKTQIQYKKIIIPNFKYNLPCLETLYIDRKIILDLIQLFLRCSFNPYITNGKYFSYPDCNTSYSYQLDTSHFGKTITLQRNRFILEDYDGIPLDTKELLDKFFKLDYDRQNLFLMSCEAYIEALNSNTGKSITYYTIALENLANNFYKLNFKNTKLTKKKRIYLFLKSLFFNEFITEDFVNHFYNIRCLYSHEGISNNRIKQSMFEVSDADEMMSRYMEEITYSALIQWLLNQKI